MKLVWSFVTIAVGLAWLVLFAGVLGGQTDIAIAAAGALALGICAPAYILARAIEGLAQKDLEPAMELPYNTPKPPNFCTDCGKPLILGETHRCGLNPR